MNLLRTLTIAVLGLALAGATISCKKEEPKTMGEKLDAAVEGAADAAAGAADAAGDAAEKVEEAAEDAAK